MAKDTILLKLELEQSRVKLQIKNLNKSLKDLDGRTLEYKNKVKQLEAAEAKLASTNIRLTQRNNQLSKSYDNLNNNLDGSTRATGAASASALELGRVVSDMPYGIRGVANNLSQFASNMMFSATAVDQATGKVVGFTGAVKGLWAALRGPLGILLAIQAAIAALDYFSNSSNNAKDSVSSLTKDSITPAVSELMLLKSVLNDSSISMSDKQQAVKDAAKEYEGLNSVIHEGNVEMTTAMTVIDGLILKYKDFAKAKALMDLFNEAIKDQQELLSKGASFGGMFSSLKAFGAAMTGAQLGVSPEQMAFNVLVEEANKQVKKFDDLLKSPSEVDPSKSYYELFFGDKGRKGKRVRLLKDPKDFNKELGDYIKNLSDADKRIRLLNAKNEIEKISIRRQFHIKNLQRTHEDNLEKFRLQAKAYKSELELYIKQQVSLGKMEQSDADNRLQSFDNYISEQEKSHASGFSNLLGQWNKYYDDLTLLASSKTKSNSSKDSSSSDDAWGLNDYLKLFKSVNSSATSFMQSEFDRQMTIEQNKTNALNQELNNRLLNEELSKDARQRIQRQIWQNDEKLRVAQEKIEKKKFKQQKAFNLSMALVDAYMAGNQVLSDPALKGQPWIRIPMAIATISSGLLNVASIARQKFQSSSASTPNRVGGLGGSSGGAGNRDFNFNLVGGNRENQLIGALQSQFNNPLKAYVVSRDITNQQQLEEDIQGTAGF